HVHTQATEFVSRLSTGGQFDIRSALELFSQVSHSCERGAVRFLLWWLFLHRRLRSGNEAQLTLNCFAPLGGSSPKGTTRFYPSGSRKARNLLFLKLFGSATGSIELTTR